MLITIVLDISKHFLLLLQVCSRRYAFLVCALLFSARCFHNRTHWSGEGWADTILVQLNTLSRVVRQRFQPVRGMGSNITVVRMFKGGKSVSAFVAPRMGSIAFAMGRTLERSW